MARHQRSTALYPHPFSKNYWRDAASELKDIKMLVVSALLIALRIALKPAAIPLAPSLYIQTATLATALGAMIFGPVMAIPAAIISDTIGFMIWPTGNYFLPFMLTEIGSTMIYALFLYRAKVSTIRVMLARFGICFFINCVLQQVIFAWQYSCMGNPEEAKEAIMGIMTVTRIFKNLALFPLEAVVMTLFLRVLLPICRKAGLVFCPEAELKIEKKQIIALVLLVVIGCGSATAYLGYRYSTSSRSADYKSEERVEINKAMTAIVEVKDSQFDGKTMVCIVDSAYRPLFGKETDYTVSVYILDEEAFAKGQADDKSYSIETLFAYSKSGPKNDPYGSMVKVGTAKLTYHEKEERLLTYNMEYLQ